jgi:N-carbamoylputrescine amidase
MREDGRLAANWQRLVDHVRFAHSRLVVLPEMPFASWLPQHANFRNSAWDAAIDAHDRWERRLRDLAPAIVAGTRPVNFGSERYNEAFIWSEAMGMRGVHAKSQLKNDKGCWERTWYQSAAAPDFEPIEVGNLTLGFLIGPELAADDEIERYGHEGVQVLISPRSTPVQDMDEWRAVASSAARRGGAVVLASTGAGQGPGWIIDPAGEMLACSSASCPFVSQTVQLPMKSAVAADAC